MSYKTNTTGENGTSKGTSTGSNGCGRAGTSGKSQSFADIYDTWTQTHDEDKAISKRLRDRSSGDGGGGQALSINSIRQMKPQATLDLHNYRLEESFVAVRSFLDDAKAKGLRKVLVITGKGIHSAGGESVLRPAVSAAIDNHPAVRETFTPKAVDGGSGAIAVILKA